MIIKPGVRLLMTYLCVTSNGTVALTHNGRKRDGRNKGGRKGGKRKGETETE